ncbi:MAG: LacI family transcriptional regulator [Chloroflexota bacterium]|nr:LacI family transcriptional regulator [Chloroflexota bacterium]
MADKSGNGAKAVAVIVSDIGNPFYVDLTRGLAERLDQDGFLCLIGDCQNDEDRQRALAENFISHGVNAMVVTTPHSPTVLGLDIPLVAVDRPKTDVPYVSVDNVLGGRLAAQHLARCEYERVGILYADKQLAPVADRLEGFRDGLSRQGRQADPALEIECESLDYEGAYEGALRLFDAGADGVFAISDVMASGALAAAKDRGLSVPDDLGIVGYDDTPMAAWPTVDLTSVAQGTFNLGMEAGSLVLKRIDSPRIKLQPTILSPRLSIRGSTRQV